MTEQITNEYLGAIEKETGEVPEIDKCRWKFPGAWFVSMPSGKFVIAGKSIHADEIQVDVYKSEQQFSDLY